MANSYGTYRPDSDSAFTAIYGGYADGEPVDEMADVVHNSGVDHRSRSAAPTEEGMRIGINIPDALYRRLSDMKGLYNISEVCRTAIEELVTQHEEATWRVTEDRIADISERYRSHDESITINWADLGMQDAHAWMRIATPAQFDNLLYRIDVLKRQRRPAWEAPPPTVEGVPDFKGRYALEIDSLVARYGDGVYDRHDFQDATDVKAAEQAYMQAWLAYVMAARAAIRARNEGGGSG